MSFGGDGICLDCDGMGFGSNRMSFKCDVWCLWRYGISLAAQGISLGHERMSYGGVLLSLFRDGMNTDSGGVSSIFAWKIPGNICLKHKESLVNREPWESAKRTKSGDILVVVLKAARA